MALIESIVVRYIRFDGCNVFISALELFYFTMPSDSETTELARSLAELKDEFRSGLSTLKRELSEEHNSALKKFKSAAASVPKFQKKGNEKQFLLNTEVLEHVQSASSFLQATPPQVDKALEDLKEGEKKLANRNKLILIADSSEQGWDVVNEYERKDLADDSDDDKRIRQAETRAFQKRRRVQSAKKTATSYSSQRSSNQANKALPSILYTPPGYSSSVSILQFSVSPAVGRGLFNSSYWPRASRGFRGGCCFSCGSFGHYRNQCPELNAQLSANQPSKRA